MLTKLAQKGFKENKPSQRNIGSYDRKGNLLNRESCLQIGERFEQSKPSQRKIASYNREGNFVEMEKFFCNLYNFFIDPGEESCRGSCLQFGNRVKRAFSRLERNPNKDKDIVFL